MDDFHGLFCQEGMFPLLTAIVDQLQVHLPPTTKPLFSINNAARTTIDSTPPTTYFLDAENATYLYDFTDFTSTEIFSNESTTTTNYTTNLYSETTISPTSLYQTTSEMTTGNYSQQIIDQSPKIKVADTNSSDKSSQKQFPMPTNSQHTAHTTQIKSSKIEIFDVLQRSGEALSKAVKDIGTSTTTGNEREVALSAPMQTLQSPMIDKEQFHMPLTAAESPRTKPQISQSSITKPDVQMLKPGNNKPEPQQPEAAITNSKPQLPPSVLTGKEYQSLEPSITRIDSQMPDIIPTHQLTRADITRPGESLLQSDISRIEQQAPQTNKHKTKTRMPQPALSDENVRLKSSIHSDPKQEIPVITKQEHALHMPLPRETELELHINSNKLSSFMNHNARDGIQPQQNARNTRFMNTHDKKTGQSDSTPKVDLSVLKRTIKDKRLQKPISVPKSGNVNDVLEYIHENGKSGRGRVLSTDTIFKPRINSISTKQPKTLPHRMSIIKPRFIFPAMSKPNVYNKASQNKDSDVRQSSEPQVRTWPVNGNDRPSEQQGEPLQSLGRLSQAKQNVDRKHGNTHTNIKEPKTRLVSAPNRLSRGIFEEQKRNNRVTITPLFDWTNNPKRAVSNTAVKNTNGMHSAMKAGPAKTEIIVKSLHGVIAHRNNADQAMRGMLHATSKSANPFRKHRISDMKQQQNSITAIDKNALQPFKSATGEVSNFRLPKKPAKRTSPIVNHSQSRDIDISSGLKEKHKPHVKMKESSGQINNINLNIRQINKPRGGMIAAVRRDSKPLQTAPFKVPSNSRTKPVFSFVDFKDLGLVMPSSK